MDTLEKRGLKIWGIVLCSVICYVTLYRVFNETDFQRYSNIFVGFIEAYLNGHFTLDYFNILPLFNSNVDIEYSFPTRIQGILATESYYIFMTYLFIALHLVTGLSPQLLIVLPLGVVFLPIMWMAVVRTYIPSNNKLNIILCTLLSIYFLLFTITTKSYGSFYVGPVSFTLFLLILLCIYKQFYSHHNRIIYVLIMLLSYISLALYWHTVLVSSLFFTLSLLIVSGSFYIYSLLSKKNDQYKRFYDFSKSIAIPSTVISLTFVHLWQSSYLIRYMAEADLWDFISKAITKFMGGVPFAVPYSFNYKELLFGKLYFNSLLLIYFLSMFLLIIPSIINIYYIKTKARNVEMFFIFSISIFIAQIIHVIAYYKTASLNFIFVPIYFTFFGVQLFANTIKKEDSFYRIAKFGIISSLIILIILSLICVFSLGITREAGETSITKYADTESSFNWLYTHADYIDNKIIVDFNILGKYFQREAHMSEIKINYTDLSVDSYSYLLGDKDHLSSDISNSYFVIDYATMKKGLPVHIVKNRALITSDFNRINTCLHQNKIYSDDYIAIFQTRKLQY